MKWSNGGSFRLVLSLALLFAGASLCFPQASAPTLPSPPPTLSMSQLKDNLTQALALCVTLKANLDLRIASFQSLQDSYQKLMQTQADLQSQIASLQQNLTLSGQQLQQAQADLQATKDLSASLQISLNQASTLLASYKADTDKAVRALEVERTGWKIAGITFGVVAVVETAYIVGHALGWFK